jgi:dCTP deaminase
MADAGILKDLKRCPKCKRKKDRKTEFHKDSSTPDGLRVYCKLCQRSNNSGQYAQHKPERAVAHKAYVENNRAKVNAKNTAWRKQVRLEVLYHYSNGSMSCACCGENNIEFLCLDHKNGGGNKHRKEIGLGGYAIYIWLRKEGFPDGYRVLCFNCNYAVIDGKSCPHAYNGSTKGGGILSSSAILENIKNGRISVEPFVPAHVNPASVDLTLGKRVLEHSLIGPNLDPRSPGEHIEYQLGEEGLVLYPGRAYLMHTEEVVHSSHFVSVLDGKSSIGRLFISVHETAGYIDPGFRGQITLEVSVTHPVRVYAGMRFCQIRYHTIYGVVDLYDGHYKEATALGPVPSMAYKQMEEQGG